ncbi:hypothetical protein LguiA_029071 [Lonicera macranthoides]
MAEKTGQPLEKVGSLPCLCCKEEHLQLGWVDSIKVIMTFEVSPEKFRVLMLPNGACASAVNSDRIQVRGHLGFLNVTYARAGEVDVNPLMNVMVVEILGYVKASDFNDDYDDNEVEQVQVMTIWILEDYHK